MIANHIATRTRTTAVVIGAVAAIGLLTGCVNGDPGPSPTSARPTPTATPSTTPTPTPTPTATASAPTPIDAASASLNPLQALYDFDPNLALLDDAAPTGALALEAVAADGAACSVMHTSSGAVIEIAVSAPGSTALATAMAAAGDPIDLGIAGAEGFSSSAGVQAFIGDRRYTAESTVAGADQLAAIIAIPISALG